jgi:hypothetical protein
VASTSCIKKGSDYFLLAEEDSDQPEPEIITINQLLKWGSEDLNTTPQFREP